MHVVVRLAFPLLATAVAYMLLMLLQMLWRDLSSPLRKLPGPKNPSLMFGNFKELEVIYLNRASGTLQPLANRDPRLTLE